jgi:hypothetical protein
MNMSKLGIFQGDCIFVKSNSKETVLIALKDSTFEGSQVKMNKSTRKNLGVGLG